MAAQTRHTPAISAQRTATDDVSDCINSQNDDVIASPPADQRTQAAVQLSELTQPRHRHGELDSDQGPSSLPLIAVHNGRTLSRQLSADYDEVEPAGRRITGRRTLSLRRQLLTTDPTDRQVNQVLGRCASNNSC